MKRLIIVVLSCFLFWGMGISQNKLLDSPSRKLQLAEFAIANLYVDKVDEDKMVETAIVSMLEQLDPHSTYSNPEEVRKLNEPLQGNFDGIGIQFNMATDTLFVIQPVSGGPSEKAGILAGDRIIQVNDTLIAGVKMSTEEVMRRLRGKKGTEVNLKIMRRGVDELLSFTVKRDKIPVYSLDASYMVTDKTGYIRINRFAATTGKEFSEALSSLQKQGMKDLILDLQGNGGGYLNAAIDLANQFLDKKELIVYTEGRRNPRSGFCQRDCVGCGARLGPWNDCRPSYLWKGTGATSGRFARRLYDTPYSSPLLHTFGTLHTETLRKHRTIQPRLDRPLQPRRNVECRQHSFSRLAQIYHS